MSYHWHQTYGVDEKIPEPKDWDPSSGKLIVKKATKKKVEE